MIAHGVPIYIALEPVNMRLGSEQLGGWCASGSEPRSRFAFLG